jgi:ATP-dependent DNA ligase
MADIIQKAVEWDKLSAKFKAQWGSIDKLDPNRWAWQAKYDGCHVIFDTRDKRVFSRSGEPVRSMDHILDQLPGGYVFQGEAYQFQTPFHEISGAFRRHSPQPQLVVKLYDVHDCDSFIAGRNEAPYSERHDELNELVEDSGGIHVVQTASLPSDLQALANRLVSCKVNAYDGVILRDMRSIWKTGPAREGQIIKVKPNVSLDLRCVKVDVRRGEKTGRDVVVITVDYRGTLTDVGSGVPHDVENPEWFVDKIVEIECMAVNPNNTLREPRFKGVRYDKEEPDT